LFHSQQQQHQQQQEMLPIALIVIGVLIASGLIVDALYRYYRDVREREALLRRQRHYH
jgi:hypothetical protein